MAGRRPRPRLRACGFRTFVEDEGEERLTVLLGADDGRDEGENKELLGGVDHARGKDGGGSGLEEDGWVVAEVLRSSSNEQDID